jgi:RNA polymerase sigma-70 factor (ECF subfamily)
MANAEVIELARKAATGSRKSFDELCAKKMQDIYFWALTALGNVQDAEDVVQEVTLYMFKNIKKLRSPEAIDVWIARIVKGKCADILRQRYRSVNEQDIDDNVVQIADDDEDFLPEEYAENEELKDKIYEIILELPQKRREAIIMYYYDDMSYKEIADITGTSTSTVATNLMKARTMIRAKLEMEEMAGLYSVSELGQILNEASAKRVTDDMVAAAHKKYLASVKDVGFAD